MNIFIPVVKYASDTCHCAVCRQVAYAFGASTFALAVRGRRVSKL